MKWALIDDNQEHGVRIRTFAYQIDNIGSMVMVVTQDDPPSVLPDPLIIATQRSRPSVTFVAGAQISDNRLVPMVGYGYNPDDWADQSQDDD